MTLQRKEKKFSVQVKKAGQESNEVQDSNPKDMTDEDIKEKYGKVVYCNFYDCVHNEKLQGLVRREDTIRGQLNFTPIGPLKTFRGVCARKEIAIQYNEVLLPGGAKFKYPTCFVPRTSAKHLDFTKRMGEVYTIDDSKDPSYKGEEWVKENLPFKN